MDNRIVIYVEGGLVQGVYAVEPIAVLVMDKDTIEFGDVDKGAFERHLKAEVRGLKEIGWRDVKDIIQ